MKKVVIIIVCFLACYIVLERFPVKRCISIEDAYEKLHADNTYICEFEAVTGANWRIYTENETTSELVCLEGNVPINDINKASFFWFGKNKFLIQGEVIGIRIVSGEGDIKDYYDVEESNKIAENIEDRCEYYDIINVTKWDIIEPIERGDSFRFLAPKNALNLFDFDWREMLKSVYIMKGK